jgi:hypothetical protein
MSPISNKKQKRFYFKQEQTYYGVIECMGEPLILTTNTEEEAIFHFEQEVDYVISVLLKNKIFADPVEIAFYGNYKPTRDNICNPEV